MKYAVLVALTLAYAWAAEPIAGTWLMKSQQVAGRRRMSRPLTLRITQTGDVLEFEYSVPQIQSRKFRYASRRGLDGSEGDVKDPAGREDRHRRKSCAIRARGISGDAARLQPADVERQNEVVQRRKDADVGVGRDCA